MVFTNSQYGILLPHKRPDIKRCNLKYLLDEIKEEDPKTIKFLKTHLLESLTGNNNNLFNDSKFNKFEKYQLKIESFS